MLSRSLRSLRLPGDGEAEAAGVTLRAVRSRSPDAREEPPRAGRRRRGKSVGVVGGRWVVGVRPPLPPASPVSLQVEGAEPSGGNAGAACPAAQSRALKAGSLPRLVRHLLEAPALGDAGYRPAFLATYRCFARPAVVLGLLLERWGGGRGRPGRVVVVCVLGRGAPFAVVLLPLGSFAIGGSRRAEVDPEAPRLQGSSGVDPLSPPWFWGHQYADDTQLFISTPNQLSDALTDLFLRLVPQECLGSAWSQRDKKGHEGDCPTVRATVAQFNLVANAVIFSCLWDTGLRAAQRARLLEKWICVAEECLLHRNFSSLYAVVSALQSTPLHRLKRTWEETSRWVRRGQEGAFSCPSSLGPMVLNLRVSLQGVIPYLGTFLKDLVMLDAATPTHLQVSPGRARGALLLPLPLQGGLGGRGRVLPSFPIHRLLSLPSSYQLSCTIEAPSEGGAPPKPSKPTLVITRSLGSLPLPNFPLTPLFLLQLDHLSGSECPPHRSPLPHFPSRLPQGKWPSVSVLDTSPPSSPGDGLAPLPATGAGFIKGHRRSASCGSVYPQAPDKGGASPSDCCIIRVSMALQNGTLYKSILVTSQDKSPTVVAKVLEKHNQDQNLAHDYELVQLLPDGRELVFPPMANVFYARNGFSLDFLLRPKGPPRKTPPPTPPPRSPRAREVDISATFPKIKSTAARSRLFSEGEELWKGDPHGSLGDPQVRTGASTQDTKLGRALSCTPGCVRVSSLRCPEAPKAGRTGGAERGSPGKGPSGD
uniref:Ral guanine nucleotide dissociation stimulator-like 2 n=1 Tax=Naja naja TaxID=35670 RepID=A0A8C6VAD8_NAJNA